MKKFTETKKDVILLKNVMKVYSFIGVFPLEKKYKTVLIIFYIVGISGVSKQYYDFTQLNDMTS